MKSIIQLDEIVESLPERDMNAFKRIFRVIFSTGKRLIPDTFNEKAYHYFRVRDETPEQTLERVRTQKVVRVVDRYTGSQSLFNELRAYKPGSRPEDAQKVRQEIDRMIEAEWVKKEWGDNGCDFCQTESMTSMDLPTRVERNSCISAGNAAAYDANNGLIIFKGNKPFERGHHPLVFTKQDFTEFLEAGSEWFLRTHRQDNDAIYPFLMWNCLQRAGASQTHGHMHVLLTSGMPYEDVEKLRSANERYEEKNGAYYFDDLFSVYESLGLGFANKNSKVFVSITPEKDREVWVTGKRLCDLVNPAHGILKYFIDRGAYAFNMGIQMPPLIRVPGWEGFPYCLRLVDRGDPLKLGTDWAGMEMFASKVISLDSFRVAQEIRDYMKNISAQQQ